MVYYHKGEIRKTKVHNLGVTSLHPRSNRESESESESEKQGDEIRKHIIFSETTDRNNNHTIIMV